MAYWWEIRCIFGVVIIHEVVGDGVLSKVNAALVLDLLYLKGDEHRQTFGSEGAERIDFPRPDGQGRVQPVKLLEFQHRKLAHMLPRHGEHRFGVAVKLLLGVCLLYTSRCV